MGEGVRGREGGRTNFLEVDVARTILRTSSSQQVSTLDQQGEVSMSNQSVNITMMEPTGEQVDDRTSRLEGKSSNQQVGV